MTARAVILAAAAAWLARSELARRSGYLAEERAAAARRHLGRNAWVPAAASRIAAELRPGEAVETVTALAHWKDDPYPVLLTGHPDGRVVRVVAMRQPDGDGGQCLSYVRVRVPPPRACAE